MRIVPCAAYLLSTMMALSLAGAAESDPVMGAEALLKAAAVPVVTAATEPLSNRPTRVEMVAFVAKPEHAVAEWLALAKRFSGPAVPASGNVDQLFAALPLPSRWPELRAGLAELAVLPVGKVNVAEKRRAAGWQLLAAALTVDRAEREKAVALGNAVMDPHDEWTMQAANSLMLQSIDDPTMLVQAVEKMLKQAEKKDLPQIELPDLVAVLGEAGALPLLRKALALPFSELNVQGAQTRALVMREALGMMDQLRSPPWSLVRGANSKALFEALEKKFPVSAERGHVNQDWQYREAEAAYLAQMISAGSIAEALKRIEQAGTQSDQLVSRLPISDLAQQRPVELTDTLRELLKKDPQRPLWNIYAQLAAQLGRADEIRSLVNTHGAAAAKQGQLIDLLLAADDVEPAIAALRAGMVLSPPVHADAINQLPGTQEGEPSAITDTEVKPELAARIHAQRLLGLAVVLERPQVAHEAAAALATLPFSPGSQWGNDTWERTRLLQQAGHAGLAEKLLLTELQQPDREWDRGHPTVLAALVRLYQSLGRSADAVLILTKAEHWGRTDLRWVDSGNDSHAHVPPLAVVAGEAFAAVGRIEEAHRCALLALDQDAACDGAYALLLRLDGAKAKPWLERLQRRDVLEERPLLWQAQLALDAGDLAAAERLARAAIAVDPSDGDQGPGDRMRDRQILAEVLEKSGRADEAKPLRTALAAIRLGERGDVFLRVGLSTRATEAYLASEKILDRTYCVQSRLAVTLAKLGRTEEAGVHFKRAFELMPNAFGRRESHCFGCEGVFTSIDARLIAEQVFSKMVVNEPKNPRHQYLLGYLRAAQLRFTEAADSFRVAIRLDPEYYSAIRHLLSLDTELRLPRTERETLTLALARMDPGQHHHDWEIAHITNLTRLHQVLEANANALSLSPEEVVILPQPTKNDAAPNDTYMGAYPTGARSIGTLLSTYPLIQSAGQIISHTR